MCANYEIDERYERYQRANRVQFICLIAMSMVTMSLESISGSVLPDLICIMDTDLKFASTLFFSYWLGQTCVCLLGIFVQDMIDMQLTLTIAMVILACCLAPVAIIQLLPLTDLIYFVIGGCCGISKIGTYVQIGSVRPNSNFAFHIVSVGGAVGFVLTPLIASVFVHHQHSRLPGREIKNWTLSTDTKVSCVNFSTNIEFIFLLLSVACMCIAVGLAINYSRLQSYESIAQPKVKEIQDSGNRRNNLIFRILLLCMMGTLTLVPTNIASLMVTYGIRSNLHLSINTASLLTSVFGFCFLVSRVVCTVFANRVRPNGMFLFFLALCLCTAVFFVVYRSSSTTELLVVCVLFGIGLGPHVACGFSWSKSYIAFTVRFVSLCFVFSGVENLVQPTICGILMDLYGPDMFAYTTCLIVFVQVILFLIVWRQARKVKKHSNITS